MSESKPQPDGPDTPATGADVAMGGRLAPKRLTREDQAKLEIGHTAMSRSTMWVLSAALLLTIGTVPVWQHVHDIRQNLQTWRQTAPAQRRWTQMLPQVYEIVRLMPDWSEIHDATAWWGYGAFFPESSEIQKYEGTVEENSVLAELTIPYVQWLLSGIAGTGNDQVVTGRGGWLFYRSDMAYVSAQPFLRPKRLREIVRHSDIQPDPVKAIVHFQRQLAARGIELLVMPTPVKPQIEPERASLRYQPADAPLNNPSYERFLAALSDAGVEVFDATALLADLKQDTGRPVYLETDTHWRPDAMEAVADALGAAIRAKLAHLEADAETYLRHPSELAAVGDVAAMLKLPEWQRLYPPETVKRHQVFGSQGDPWRARIDSPVLLLGDSFTNIYSAPTLGWGEAAGFAEQLSYALQMPIDRIAVNAGGAHSARESLAADLRAHYHVFERSGHPPARERLADKKLVVYQFAARELLHGDWKLIDLPAARPEAFGQVRETRPDVAPETLTVRGVIADIARPPRPGSVPYRDAVVAIHLVDVDVAAGAPPDVDDELLVFAMGMRGNVWTPAARLRQGREVELQLMPWEAVEPTYGSIQRIDLGTDADFLYPVWWADGIDTGQIPSAQR